MTAGPIATAMVIFMPLVHRALEQIFIKDVTVAFYIHLSLDPVPATATA